MPLHSCRIMYIMLTRDVAPKGGASQGLEA